MDINTIPLDPPVRPQAANTPRGGNGSFQVAYARVLGETYAPPARESAPAHPPRGQDGSPPRDRTAHAVRAGETLYGIVRARLATMGVEANPKTTMQGVIQLAQANNIRNPDRIYVGRKLDLAALDSLFVRSDTVSRASGIDSSARVARQIEQPQQRDWEHPVPEDDAQLAAENAAALPMPIAALPPATPTLASDDAVADVDAGAGTPLAARQLALYEQNASIAAEKPAQPVRGLPDIVYKGVVGKVLDAMPLDASTRTGLQQASTVVGSTFTARSLGALTGLGGPLLTLAGLIWGTFSSRQIEAAAGGESKATGATKPAVNPKPAANAVQTAQNTPPEALN